MYNGGASLRQYLKNIYNTRYFWTHLAKSDLKYKFRRSKLGILWTVLNPLLLTLLMTIVFGTIFKISYTTYAPYILSGLIVWELLTSSVIGGSSAILAGECYIRQFNHPVSIYPLRAALVNTISFLIAQIALIIWLIFMYPENIILGIITLPLTTIIYFLVSWPIVIISSFMGTKYRDYPQVMTLVMQALWYVSPVFFSVDMFQSNKLVQAFFSQSPVTHFLNLIREPYLYGRLPSYADYLYVLATMIILFICAIVKVYRNEKDIIFYL